MYAMNQNLNAGDPSGLVPPQILPHVHLVSSYRFPTLAALQPAQALEYLIKGPTIVKDTAAVAWTYFASPPPDGTVLLTWQPPRMGTHFASDGLVWADPEIAYDMNIRGYNLQVMVHKSGFQYPNEAFSTHARYRYHITQGPGHIDPSLWVVHYFTAEPANRIPSNTIATPRDMHGVLQGRAQLESAGQLIRKDFMLADRQNWPKVEFTRGAGAQQPPYYNPMQPGRPYNQPPPSKRARTNGQARPPVPPTMVADPSLDEEENSTQDFFDFLTPRDISLSRYRQHHEWMEEIFSSPYDVRKILPIDLGLGLMGELGGLTDGILDTPGGEHPPLSSKSRGNDYEVKPYQKLHPDDLKDFEARVEGYTQKKEAELEKLRATHANKMARLKRSRTYIRAERRLRDVARSGSAHSTDAADPVDSVVSELEASLGVAFDSKQEVVCVDKGGYMEQQAPPQKAQQINGNGPSNSNTDAGSAGLMDAIDAENSAASLLEQYGSNSLTGTPGASLSVPPISQPPSQAQSAVATPSAPVVDPSQSTALDIQATHEATNSGSDLLDLDVEMSGMTDPEGKGEGDWVVVDSADTTQPLVGNDLTHSATAVVADTAAATSGVDVGATASMFDTADFGSFDNLDTAGDALADYTNVDNLGLDLVDDSAFGDAFHGTEMHHGETPDGDNV
ncbi:DUF1750-domain-containing protein [Lophiostoma macrostomum CBS 122681]|uniref:DUF1750-domain-containing protein n=1 Tax=Lophiostoma macrostomum CBS 122681 TaxID=1314788 RepID=A0A6A6TRV7_9PLEO|nr:DUF1750-domain-containing protein [Lophiostoma macrostomum CBS 122681]